jgi:hypothetical protein
MIAIFVDSNLKMYVNFFRGFDEDSESKNKKGWDILVLGERYHSLKLNEKN